MTATFTDTASNVVWVPLPGSQQLAVTAPCNHILYEGTRGPGKTEAQLMAFRKNVGKGYGQYYRGIIFDREYKNLDDIISKSERIFPKFNDGAKFNRSPHSLKWVWPTGEELLFRQFKSEKDYDNYHGHEYCFIGWNELSKWPDSAGYDAMLSCNRSSFVPELHSPIDPETGQRELLPEIPLQVFSTTNPYGPGRNWLKDRFIDVAPPGVVVEKVTSAYNPRTKQREDVVTTQVRLFGSYKENPYLSPTYIAEMEGITDQNKRKAWLHGDWDITSGGMFDDVWDTQYNVVDEFDIPEGWRIFRSFDWGSSKPFSVGWWAESNGEDVVLPNGKVLHTLRGDLFRIDEWYGWDGNPNKGLRLLATQIAKGIIEREMQRGWHNRVKPGPADSSIYNDENGMCIARDMEQRVKINGQSYKGVMWTRANKSPGSRKNGWEKVRIALQNAHPGEQGVRESAGLFVFRRCTDGFIRTFPVLPRSRKDPDDVDTDAEDHVADEVRYVILSAGDRYQSGGVIGNY